YAETRPGPRRRDAGTGDVRDLGRGICSEPGEEDRGRRRPRRQEPDSVVAEGRAEIPRRGGRARHRHHPRASPPERNAAAKGGGGMRLGTHELLPPPLRGRVGEGGGPESLCPWGPPTPTPK